MKASEHLKFNTLVKYTMRQFLDRRQYKLMDKDLDIYFYKEFDLYRNGLTGCEMIDGFIDVPIVNI